MLLGNKRPIICVRLLRVRIHQGGLCSMAAPVRRSLWQQVLKVQADLHHAETRCMMMSLRRPDAEAGIEGRQTKLKQGVDTSLELILVETRASA